MYLGARLEPTVARGLSRVVHLEGENAFASSRMSLTLLKEIHTPLQRCTRACVDTCLLKHGHKCTCGEAHAASSVTVSCGASRGSLAVSHPHGRAAEPHAPQNASRALRSPGLRPAGPAATGVLLGPGWHRDRLRHLCCVLRTAGPSAFCRATAQCPHVTPFVYLTTC